MQSAALVSDVQERVQNLLEYLIEYNRLKSPPKLQISEYNWQLSLTSLPIHPSIEVFIQAPEESEERTLLQVSRPKLTDCPPPPKELTPWLRSGWDAYERKDAFLIHPSEIKGQSEADSEDEDTEFEHPPKILGMFNEWNQERQEWRVEETPARQANQLFDRFFELKSTLERDGEKYAITLGTGILRWKTDDNRKVEHHLLSQRCSLSFDPEIPRFSISFSDDPVQFPTNLLRDVADVDLSGLPPLVDSLRHTSFDLLSEEADDFLTGLSRRLWSQGEYYDSPAMEVPADKPTVQKSPVLILEPRGRGYVDAAQHLLMNMADFVPPAALCDLVGLPLPPNEGKRNFAASMPLLFTKPSNQEQERVARRLAANSSVLVQGPPGTGKTHTIANLIGHLLAQGKSILVTSHTSKALTVVREKVAPQLQGLCVSVLDDGNEGQKQLASAVASIADKLTETTEDELTQQAQALKQKREALVKDLETAQAKLLAAHRSEYESLSVAGEDIMPSEAARKLRDWQGRHDWIPGSVPTGQPCPLSEADLRELYRLQELLPAEDEDLILSGLPPSQKLPEPAEFEKLCQREIEIRELGTEAHADLWSGTSHCSDSLNDILQSAEKVVSTLGNEDSLHAECLACGENEQDAAIWHELCELIKQTADVVAEHRSIILERGPMVSQIQMPLRRQLEVCEQILDQVRAKGKIGFMAKMFKSEWKVFLAACSVDGNAPERAEDFEAVFAHLKTISAREKLTARWQRQTEALNCPKLSPDAPEREAQTLSHKIKDALEWSGREWKAFEEAVSKAGFDWNRLLNAQSVDPGDRGRLKVRKRTVEGPLLDALRAKVRALELAALSETVEAARSTLSSYTSTLGKSLTNALEERKPALYQEKFSELKKLETQVERANQRAEFLKKLEAAAPEWARRIADRTEPHQGPEPPGPLREAWLFAQWSRQLQERHSLDLDQLQHRCTQLKEQIRTCTARYVEILTWMYQARRTGNAQQQALIGWLQLVRKIGKGTGKKAPRLKAKARERLRECREAVPVWIMPFSRVVESYRPGETMFDVVIVDEASQADVTGLLALCLGKELIVVGDHEQVSPSGIGEKFEKVMSLADEHLQSIPNRELFDGGSSVYDMAQRAFGETIRLKEHFRCVPEIIAFSNQLCYEGDIRPLREGDNILTPAVVSHRVPNGVRQGKAKTNDLEAKEIASLIAACCKHPDYAGKTFGVISLVGDDQAYLIEKYLLSKLDPKTVQERRILCGNAAQFQGDERDVIFLSMVDSPTGNGPLRLVGSRKNIVQRYNVAASRAKDQMWVVHSLDPPNDLKPDDIRFKLLKTAEQSVEDEYAKLVTKAESVFEQKVMEHLVRAGYRVQPQLPIGAYRVDMVVIGQSCRVAVECDGDAYHPPEQLEADIARQEILERVGNLTFIRIRGSAYFRDPDNAMKQVLRRLEELGVEKLGPKESHSKTSELPKEISSLALEVRKEWWPEDDYSAPVQPADDVWEGVRSVLSEWPSLDLLPHVSKLRATALKIAHNNDEIVIVDRASEELELFQKQAKADFVDVIVVDPSAPDEARYQILSAFNLHEMTDSREVPAVEEEKEPAPQEERVSESPPEPVEQTPVLSQNEAIVSILMDVAKADGVLLPEELNEIPRFFEERFRYGEEALKEIHRLVPLYAEQQPPRSDVGKVVRAMEPSIKELVLKAAIELAWSDDEFHEEEKRVILRLGMEFDIPRQTVDALLDQSEPDHFDPYQALELESDATAEEIEEAVSALRNRFSEEKFKSLGPEFQELAATRRQEIERAWGQLGSVVRSVEVVDSDEVEEQPVEVSSETTIEAYQDFVGQAGPVPDEGPAIEVRDGLLRIIEVEGPVQVRRAFKIYLDGCGLKKLGSRLREALTEALETAVSNGRVVLSKETSDDDILEQFVRVSGTPEIRLRTLGSRVFDEVSLREIAEYSRMLEAEFKRRSAGQIDALTTFYGIGRQTTRIRQRLEQAIELREYLGGEVPEAAASHPGPTSSGDESDYFSEEVAESPEGKLAQIEEAILQLFERKPRRTAIVKARLGIGGEEIQTLQELGEKFEVTRERVRQIEAKALKDVQALIRLGRAKFVTLHPELFSWLSTFNIAIEKASLRGVTPFSVFEERVSRDVSFIPNFESGIPSFLLAMHQLAFTDGRYNKRFVFRDTTPSKVNEWLSWFGEFEASFRADTRTWTKESFQEKFGRQAERKRVTVDELISFLTVEFVSEEEFRVPLQALTGRTNQAYRVLQDNGRPMHFQEIAQAINASGAKPIEERSLGNQLGSDDRLACVGRSGQWALREWGDEGTLTIKETMANILEESEKPLSQAELWQRVREVRSCSPGSISLYLSNDPTFKRVGLDSYTYDPEAGQEDDWAYNKVGGWIEEFFRRSFHTVVPFETLRQAIGEKAPELDEKSLNGVLGHHPAVESIRDRSGKTLVALKPNWRNSQKKRKRRHTLQDEVNELLQEFLKADGQVSLNDAVKHLNEETGSPPSALYGYIERSVVCEKYEVDGVKYLRGLETFGKV